MSTIPQNPLLRVGDAARELGVHPNTVRRWVSAGELDVIRLGAGPKPAIRIAPDDLAAFLQRGRSA